MMKERTEEILKRGHKVTSFFSTAYTTADAGHLPCLDDLARLEID